MKELISTLRKKKPKFRRTDSNKYKFKNKWRSPRGLQNKQRLKRKGHVKSPSVGYGTPSEIKYIDSNTGLKKVLISNIKQLEDIDSKKESVLISGKLGIKKKVELLKICQEKKLTVDNVKEISEYLETVEKSMKIKKTTKQKELERKTKEREEALKKKKGKEDSKKSDKEVKEEVLESKIKEKTQVKIPKQKDTTQAKEGHNKSSIPGTKQ